MTIATYRSWSPLAEFAADLPRLFRRYPTTTVERSYAADQWLPSTDIVESAEGYTLYLDLPGVVTNDIEITSEDGVLSVSGKREVPTQAESVGYRRQERASGSFRRRFALPEEADANNITAEGRDGVLEINIPKVEKVQPRRIEIKS